MPSQSLVYGTLVRQLLQAKFIGECCWLYLNGGLSTHSMKGGGRNSSGNKSLNVESSWRLNAMMKGALTIVVDPKLNDPF